MRGSGEAEFVDFATAAKPWLLTTAWMLTADAHAAEDLVQETLVRVYLKWRRIGSQQPAAYARRVLANLHTDRWRRQHREVLVGEPDSGEQRHTPDRRRPGDPGDGASVDLVRALQTLGTRERECVVMRHYLDLSEQQTAEALGVSVGSVKGYTSRGLAALRPLLSEEENHV